MSIKNKVFMISGGTGQVGQVLCCRLIEKEAKIYTQHRSNEKLNQLFNLIPEKYHKNLYSYEAEITTEDKVKKWIEKALDQFKKIDGFVHTLGGIHPKTPIAEMDVETWNKSITINLNSSFILAKSILPYFIEQKRGKMIFISALAGLKGEPGKGAYSASKAGLIRMAEAISEETKRYNIQTNVVIPSILKTPANLSWGEKKEIEKWVDPDDFVDLIIFLLSNMADAITGATIPITGKY